MNAAQATAALAVALGGCSLASPPPGTMALAASASARGHGSIDLTGVEFRLEDAQGRPLSMSAEGTLTGPQGFWGRATADGTVSFPDGSVRGRLLADDRVVDAKGETLASIAADGSAQVGGQALRFDDTGRLVGANPEHPVRLVGDGARIRRAAMLVLILSQLRHSQEPGRP